LTQARLTFNDVTIRYLNAEGRPAVDGVSLEIAAGEFFGLVGESGSGKSTLANSVVGMAPVSGGEIVLDAYRLTPTAQEDLRRIRRNVQIVMQDPFDSLNPFMSIGNIVAEPLVVQNIRMSPAARREKIVAVLEEVGLCPAESFLHRRPHELSGGQRQRVSIAAALMLKPTLIIADEPVSMLDVSVRAGVLHMLDRIRIQHDASILMITHDLPTAVSFCDRIAVMKSGKIVEMGVGKTIAQAPEDAYTRELIGAVPKERRRQQNSD
jgi:peptide/nickel transport system ATP-binding protein